MMKIEDIINKVHNVDCLEFMNQIPNNCVSSVVTDPPYGISFMGKEWDSFDPKYQKVQMERESKRRPRTDGRKATGFQGSVYAGLYDLTPQGMIRFQQWYYEIAKEFLRVLKPGGYLLSFGGTRTSHRMVCAIEDAGFEIRDMIAWVYGSGFPKSLNIGKAVDKLQGNAREDSSNLTSCPDFPKPCKGHPTANGSLGGGVMRYAKASKGTSEYEGWGTALKPALEPICVARKPLSEKTVAENVLKWGTGGINIDGCRVGTTETITHGGRLNPSAGDTRTGKALGMFKGGTPNLFKKNPAGRFPANFIHDGSDEVVRLFPESKVSGAAKSGKVNQNGIDYSNDKNIFGGGLGQKTGTLHNDSGSASRFFYCAKASKSDRNEGLDGFEEIEIKGDVSLRQTGTHGQTGKPNKPLKSRNHHPTVKPTSLMRYLVKLVTPKNGIVLDPFMGSGSTGKACKIEKFDFIGIEKEKEYCKIAEERINKAKSQLQLF